MSERIINLLRPEVQFFIGTHESDDENALILKHKKILGLPAVLIAEQLVGRRKAREKLPTLYETQGIIYPPSLALEQCSSESTAQFKTSFLTSVLRLNSSKAYGADLTGGWGIDSLFLSRACSQWSYVETQESLFEIAQHNHGVLGASNIYHHHTDAERFLRSTSDKFDFIFIDPSRRKNAQKVFRLADGEPVISQLLPLIFQKTNTLLVKASPMLDLHQGLNELKCVKEIVVLSVENECKELLFLCNNEGFQEPRIRCVNLLPRIPEAQEFCFTFPEEANTKSVFSEPLAYLYEPNVSILKAGAFKLIGQKSGLAKLHTHTHLYTSEKYKADFPGRVFKIENKNPDPKKLNVIFSERKANVLCRNYPLSPEQLKKKLKLKDGGERYLIAGSGMKKKFLVAATRMK